MANSNNYSLYVSELYIDDNETTLVDGKYTVGVTKPCVKFNAVATHGVSCFQMKMTGHSDQPMIRDARRWDGFLINQIGSIDICVRVQDCKGNWSGWKKMCITAHDHCHKLDITNFCAEKKVEVDNTPFIMRVEWNSTHDIKTVKFKVTGSNEFDGIITNPKGRSCTWTSPNVEHMGCNKVTVTITDEKGKSESCTISVESHYPNDCLKLDVDLNPEKCNLIDGQLYKDVSNLSLDIKVQHRFPLKKLTANAFGQTHNISINGNTSSITWNYGKLTNAGAFKVIITAVDIYENTVSREYTYNTLAVVAAPPPPVIEYVFPDKRCFLAEGYKIKFRGTSNDIDDYKVICALQACDVEAATEFCDEIETSYFDADKDKLRDNLLNAATGEVEYIVYKDFDEKHVGFWRTGKGEFCIYAQTLDDEDSDFYVLQWIKQAKPGHLIRFYVIERRRGTFGTLYSTSDPWNAIPLKHMFPMCVIPLSPCKIKFKKVTQTDDKLTVEYSNPIHGFKFGKKNPTHLIDICLIVKDSTGKIIDKTEEKRRDSRHGRCWMYYTDRRWHNLIPHVDWSEATKTYTMDFDISIYPRNCTYYVVAFYYCDYYYHPSIYSISTIMVSRKQDLDMRLEIVQPENKSEVNTPNPDVQLIVHNDSTVVDPESCLFEEVEWKVYWTVEAVHFRHSHRHKKHCHMPHFDMKHCHKKHQHHHDRITCPKHHRNWFHLHKTVYFNPSLFEVEETEEEPVFNENHAFLRVNGGKEIDLGEINTDELLENKQQVFNYVQETGRMLISGENTIEAFTCPVIYEKSETKYEKIEGTWLSGKIFDCHIMDHIPWPMPVKEHCGFKPKTHGWDRCHKEVLKVKIPYSVLRENTKYNFTFGFYATPGFHWHKDHCFHRTPRHDGHDHDLDDICRSFIRVDVDNDSVMLNKEFLIYSPKVILAGPGTVICHHHDCYNKWNYETITLTTPKDFKKTKKKNLEITFIGRGIKRLKIKKVSFISVGGVVVEPEEGKVDTSIKQNQTQITVNYKKYNVEFNYIDPMKAANIIDLREKLLILQSQYRVEGLVPEWRELTPHQDYLMARDFNDIRQYCIDLFTMLQKKYCKCNPELFKELPIIVKGDQRGLNTYSSRGGHYFPEWDDLIDALKLQDMDEEIEEFFESTQCATWSMTDNKLIRIDKPIYLFNENNDVGYIEPAKPPVVERFTGNILDVDFWDCSSLKDRGCGWMSKISILAAKVTIRGTDTQHKIVIKSGVDMETAICTGPSNHTLSESLYFKFSTFHVIGPDPVWVELYSKSTGQLLDSKKFTIDVKHAYRKPHCKLHRKHDHRGDFIRVECSSWPHDIGIRNKVGILKVYFYTSNIAKKRLIHTYNDSFLDFDHRFSRDLGKEYYLLFEYDDGDHIITSTVYYKYMNGVDNLWFV